MHRHNLSWWERVKARAGDFASQHSRGLKITAGLLVAVIGLQLVYPSDRVLPFARLNGELVGIATKSDVAAKLQREYVSGNVVTTIRGERAKVPVAESGLTADNDRILSGLTNYPWYLRIIPLSSFVKGAFTNQSVYARTDTTKFDVYYPKRLKECSVAPKNAGVVVKDGAVRLDPAKDGQTCSKDSLRRQLTAKPLEKSGTDVRVTTTAVKPERSDRDVQPLLDRAREVADHKLTIVVADKPYQPEKAVIASWLAFPEDPTTKQPTLGLNNEVVKAYLETIQKDTYIEPGTTVITTVDSIEKSRTTGASGRGIDTVPTIAVITAQLLDGDGTVQAALSVLSPKVAYNRSYSKTPEGLQALVNDLVKDKGDFAISVRKLGDAGVNTNGDKQYHPASTYKLFVAYSVLKRVDANQMSLGQPTSGGQTLGQCLDNMIVNSDNACAEWFGQSIGWNTLTSEARSIGASRTSLNRPFVSTTNDQALLLQKLESNQLGLSEASRGKLLDAMKRQVFRKGIPVGVGVQVANKVGFLDGYLHDSAIVYGSKGVYVLVIYSNNSSWASIADAAKKINDFLGSL